MNIELERQEIIEELKNVHDEWVIKAIKRLLVMDEYEHIPAEHQHILNERLESYESGNAKTMEFDDVKARLLGKK